MKTAAKLLILALAVLWGLASCAPKAIIVDPVTPQAARARAEVKAAADSAKRVKATVETASVQAKGIVVEVNRAATEVERLRKIATVAPDDFAALWLMMTDLKSIASAHEIQVGRAAAETVEQGHLQDAAGKSLESLEAAAIAHDKSVEQLKSHAAKIEQQAAVSGVYRTWAIIAAVSLGLLLGGGIFLQRIKPGILA